MGHEEKRLIRGSIDRAGLDRAGLANAGSAWVHQGLMGEYQADVRDYSHAVSMLLETLARSDHSILPSLDCIDAVGHRVVHGSDRFSSSVKIDDVVMNFLRDNLHIAPLHNPSNLAGIESIARLLPNVPQVAVFDTAFHQTLPPHAYLYALPYELCEKHHIRRYGFHGISHSFIMQEAARILNRPAGKLRLITCHLGNGSSIAAIKNGASVDTTMGFTPLEGLAMGTRCGDLDPAIVLFLKDRAGMDPAEISDLLNKKSGMAGLSGYSSDMREILKAVYIDGRSGTLNVAHPHHERSKLALNIYIYRVKKYIGAYASALGGVDAIVFTGGIGQNLSAVQEEACAGLEFMGAEIGVARDLGDGCCELSRPNSAVRVLTIPTDEELMIARDTFRILHTAGGFRRHGL